MNMNFHMSEEEKQKAIKVMNDKYKKGEKPTLEECCEGLTCFIMQIASKYINTNSASMAEDFYQQGFLAICEHYEDYDPSCGAPTTFFQGHIKGAIQKNSDNSVQKISPYYSKRKREIEKAIENLNEAGIQNPTDKQIQIELMKKNPKLRIFSIRRARNIINCAKEVSYDNEDFALANSEDAGMLTVSPEVKFIHEEMKMTLKEAITTLTPLQQEIINLKFFSDESTDGPVKNREIAKKLDKNQDRIRREYNIAIKKLAQNKDLRIFSENDELKKKQDCQHAHVIGLATTKSAETQMSAIDGMIKANTDIKEVKKEKEKKKKNRYNDFSG